MTNATTPEAPRTALRIHHARLIDGTGAAPVDDAVVAVDAEGTLTYAGPAATAPPASENASPVREIDAGGRTVLPGFFDCHVHLAYAQGSRPAAAPNSTPSWSPWTPPGGCARPSTRASPAPATWAG